MSIGLGVFCLDFHCPGCGYAHGPYIGPKQTPQSQRWKWNGDLVKPVCMPSLKVTSTTWDKAVGKQVPTMCHSFIGCNGAKPGQIIYLGDCTHELKNKTIDIPVWKEWQ